MLRFTQELFFEAHTAQQRVISEVHLEAAARRVGDERALLLLKERVVADRMPLLSLLVYRRSRCACRCIQAHAHAPVYACGEREASQLSMPASYLLPVPLAAPLSSLQPLFTTPHDAPSLSSAHTLCLLSPSRQRHICHLCRLPTSLFKSSSPCSPSAGMQHHRSCHGSFLHGGPTQCVSAERKAVSSVRASDGQRVLPSSSARCALLSRVMNALQQPHWVWRCKPRQE